MVEDAGDMHDAILEVCNLGTHTPICPFLFLAPHNFVKFLNYVPLQPASERMNSRVTGSILFIEIYSTSSGKGQQSRVYKSMNCGMYISDFCADMQLEVRLGRQPIVDFYTPDLYGLSISWKRCQDGCSFFSNFPMFVFCGY